MPDERLDLRAPFCAPIALPTADRAMTVAGGRQPEEKIVGRQIGGQQTGAARSRAVNIFGGPRDENSLGV